MKTPASKLTMWVATLAVAMVTGAAGCQKKEAPPAAPPPTTGTPAAAAVRVTNVQLGNALGPDKRVQTPAESFASKDTIFASVGLEGAAPLAEITARWTFQDGQLVNETKRAISPTAKDVIEFSIQKPDGLPTGEYTVAILLDGKPAESKKFKVQ